MAPVELHIFGLCDYELSLRVDDAMFFGRVSDRWFVDMEFILTPVRGHDPNHPTP